MPASLVIGRWYNRLMSPVTSHLTYEKWLSSEIVNGIQPSFNQRKSFGM